MTTRRKSANVYDYPEHLNPFHEEDNHSRLRFWTVTKKKTRSNSFSFQSIKDFRGSIRLPRSRNRTDTSSSLSQLSCLGTKPKNATHTESETNQSHNRFFSTLRKLSRSLSIRNKNKNSTSSLEQTSQIENDEVQLRVSPSVRQPSESYSVSQRLSVTPLPRSRFHERVRNSENPEPAKLDSLASTPTDDNNPFNDDTDEEAKEILRPHSPSKPATPARKKKRAPPPPPLRQSSLKAKSFTDYKASKQNEGHTSVAQEQIEAINIDNNVNIQINVEEVTFTDSNETTKQNETTVNYDKTTHNDQENMVESTQNDSTVTEQVSETKAAEEVPAASELQTPPVCALTEENSPVSEKPEENSPVSEKPEDNSPVPEKPGEISPAPEKPEEIPPVPEKPDEILLVSEKNEESSSSRETTPMSDITDTEDTINFNSELSLSSSHSSVSSEAKLEQIEQELQENAIQDTSDLLELVTKLKMEVDKLTDDTNNNIVETEEERKVRNIESWIKLDSPNKIKTELNVYLDKNDDDDDDVVCSAPMSPRVRLRKDSDWIRQPN